MKKNKKKGKPVIPRLKIKMKDGREYYVYGNGPWKGIDPSDIVSSEHAGHYDPNKNDVQMTEPVTLFEGCIAPGA